MFISKIVYYVTLISLFISGTFGFNPKSHGDTFVMPANYELVWQDEFDGDSLNKNLWEVDECAKRGGFWGSDQVFVNDGNLHIRTMYDENGRQGAGYYTGAVHSKDEWTRGYFEMRCIHLDATGVWSAFWLMCDGVGDETSDGVNGTEIDIVESPYSGSAPNRGRVQSAICYNGYGTKYTRETAALPVISESKSSIYEQYHTYSCLWTETEYIFYIDGKETGRIQKTETSNVDEYLVLSGEVGGKNGVPGSDWLFVGKLNDKNVCTDFIIDYVRVYQEK